jgi:2-polyprenyl-3-methyl-5-hydroxy-6-metoxy-1,4-benzoquinol methylase
LAGIEEQILAVSQKSRVPVNTMKSEFKCPSCGSSEGKCVGAIPHAFHFLSQLSETPVNAGSLINCDVCGLFYRSPCLSEEELLALYKVAPTSLWNSGSDPDCRDREDFQCILEEITKQGRPETICDIGCHTGDLLVFLRDRLESSGLPKRIFGVEPSFSAAKVSEERGVRVIRRTLKDAVNSGTKFDLIVAIDVFEHVPNSAAFV